jgi:hypothetical protein
VTGWGSYSFAFGPLMAVGALLLLIAVLRWSSSTGGSLVARTPRPSEPDDYGALVVVSVPPTYVDGEVQRLRLADAGIRATVARTTAGPRVMVFPEDEDRAWSLLREPGPGPARG